MKHHPDLLPDPPPDLSPAEAREASDGYEYPDNDEEGSTWEQHQDAGTFPAWL